MKPDATNKTIYVLLLNTFFNVTKYFTLYIPTKMSVNNIYI